MCRSTREVFLEVLLELVSLTRKLTSCTIGHAVQPTSSRWGRLIRFNGSHDYASSDMVEDHDGVGWLLEFQRLGGPIRVG